MLFRSSKPVNKFELLDSLVRSIAVNRDIEQNNETAIDNFKANLNKELYGARILLVEDNDLNQEFVSELLSQSGIIVSVANNGQEAIEMLSSESFDAVLMDMQMTVMDGITATREIRKNTEYKQLPIIALTANVMEDAREAVFEAGMNDFASKPLDIQQLFTTLRKWVKPKESAEISLLSATEPMNDIDSFPSLEGVDTEIGLNSLGNVAYRKLLLKFANRYRGFDTDFNDLLKTDKESALNLIHSLKGVSGNLFVNKVYLLTIDLEKKIIEDSGEISAGVDLLQSTLHSLIQSIDEAFLISEDEPKLSVDESVDKQSFKSLIKEMSDLLKSYSISSID